MRAALLSIFLATLVALAALFGITASTALASGATWTQQTAAGQRGWEEVVSSADGEKLAAVPFADADGNADYFYTSTDGGVTWTQQTGSGQHFWNSIASSADGTHLIANACDADDCSTGANIYTSTDGGVTWTQRTVPLEVWGAVTSSADGEKLAISAQCGVECSGGGNGDIYTSTDGGATWTQRTAAGARQWFGLASSADGTKLAAADANNGAGGYIYTSTDGGMTWATSTAAGAREWSSISSSADGTKLAAVDAGSGAGGDIYTSTDGGATWTDQTAAGTRNWLSITSSADGIKLAADIGDAPGDIYTSSDGGDTWTDQTAAGTQFWGGITSSADGSKVAAAEAFDATCSNPGYIWTATLSPTLTTSAASSVFPTGATLNGSIDEVGNGTSTTEGFVYGADTAYGATTTESGSFGTGSFTAGIAPLTCNTTYHYAAYATNGYLGYGNDQTFTTSACPSSSGGGMVVGSGPLAPSPFFFNYKPPVFQIIYPDGHVVYPATSFAAHPASTASSSASYTFTQNRKLNDSGPDILTLQQFLNTHGFQVASSGPGSPGSESDYFGAKTYQALVKFQQANNLPATGYFGPLTRALVNSQDR
jgi:hypothetical protein